MPKKPLEQYRIFPFIAWFLVISFSVFVYQLTGELKTTQQQLEQQINDLETKANTNPAELINL